MTAPSERPPDAGAETRPAEEPAQEDNSVLQILKDSTNLLIAFGGVATVVTLIFTWEILGSSNSRKWFAVGGATAIAVSWTCGCRLLKTKRLSTLVGVSMSSIGIACICVTAAVLHPGEMQTPMRENGSASENTVMHSTTIRFDQRGTTDDPVQVECQDIVQVSGHVPKGYEFAIGNLLIGPDAGNAVPAFVPETAGAALDGGSTWRIPVTFGNASNGGDRFLTYLDVMPSQELNYLLQEAQDIRVAEVQQTLTGDAQKIAEQSALEQSWWIASGMPPAPAFIADKQIYRQASGKSNCSS